MSVTLIHEELVKRNLSEKDISDEALRKIMLIKFAIGAIIITICNGVAIGQMGEGKNLNVKNNAASIQYAQKFFNCRSRMGGSVLEPLVSRLNDINDAAMSHAIPRTARAVAMSEIAGCIGPVDYHRRIRTKTITSTQSIGTIQGYSPDMGFVTGDIYAPVSSTKTKIGNYVCDVPNGFKAALGEMITIGRRGHARANAEVAACIFVDATKGMIGMDERKAFKLFESAASFGEAEAMFMQAFCLFYGIGRKDVSKAYRVLLDWEQYTASQPLRNSGWARRRLSEAHEMIQN